MNRLTNDEKRLIVAALDCYVERCSSWISRRERTLKMIDTLTAQGRLDAEEMKVDIAVASGRKEFAERLLTRIAQTIRETCN